MTPYLTRAAAGLALILTTAWGSASVHAQARSASIAPRQLALPLTAFPRGANLTHTHVDHTARAVDAETVLATSAGQSQQGRLYASLHSTGSLYQYAVLREDGSIAYMATAFPTTGAAQAAWTGDTSFLAAQYACRKPSLVAVVGRYSTCAWQLSSTSQCLGNRRHWEC